MAWEASRKLAHTLPGARRRAAGPSTPLAWLGVALLVTGFVAVVVAAAVLNAPLGPWVLFPVYALIPLPMLGLFIFVWAAPDEFIATATKVVRIVGSGGRRAGLFLSSAISLTVIGFLVAGVKSELPGWALLLLLAFSILGAIVSVGCLSTGTPVVSVTSDVRGYQGRRWGLLIFSLAVCTVGAVVGAGAGRYLSAQAVWPSVTLAVVGIAVSIFVQHHRDLNDSLDTLDHALATLYLELAKSASDQGQLRSAAIEVESAITVRERGPLSIEPLPLVDDALRTCMYYLLAVVADLPIRVTTEGEAAVLAAHLGGKDPRTLLADLCWEIRRRLSRPAKLIRHLDKRAYIAVPYPRLPAPESEEPIAVTPDDERHHATARDSEPVISL